MTLADLPDTATQERTRAPSGARNANRESARLDSSRIKLHSPGQAVATADDQRREKWATIAPIGKFLSPLSTPLADGHVKPVRVARCAWTIGQQVGIMHDDGLPAGYTGIERCGSIWACPRCSAVIRAGRAREIEQAVTAHQNEGGHLAFVTLTLRHHQGDQLAFTLDTVLRAWQKTVSSSAWTRQKKRYEISGYIRSIEVTHGQNGWHPHAHVLLFFDRRISADEMSALRGWLFDRWARIVTTMGGKLPTERGLDFQRVDRAGKVLARYLGKVQEKKRWSVGAEIARGDAKSGRGESIMPLELLRPVEGMTEQRRAQLYREFYSATHGRRAITWSRGLKARFEIGEKDDEEILEDNDLTRLVWLTPSRVFRAVRRTEPVQLAIALEHAESADYDHLAKILPPASRTDPPDG